MLGRVGVIPFPIIPAAMLDVSGLIEPCPEVRDWARAMFIGPDAIIANDDHDHLEQACVEFLWTNVPNEPDRGFGRRIGGTAELGRPAGKPWIKARKQEQLHRWFGHVPDFIITLDVLFLHKGEPAVICGLIYHELCHCAQARDDMGDLRYSSEGDPLWAMRPHDIEQFTSVVRLFGPTAQGEREYIDAAKQEPLFGPVDLRGLCGTC